ncbi:sulfurtransferase TusA family protein [Bacillaceae bacterium]
MSVSIKVDQVLDCTGLSCPMPVVKTKQSMDQLAPGKVLEIRATDRGSLADLKGWAARTGNHYLGYKEEEGVIKHYLRKADPHEVKEEKKFPHFVTNEELQGKLNAENILVLDVREPAEYAFGHIPGAKLIPFGELEQRLDEIDSTKEIYVICRTGRRSDMACHLLAEKGFNVKNVVPGMSQWSGAIEQD